MRAGAGALGAHSAPVLRAGRERGGGRLRVRAPRDEDPVSRARHRVARRACGAGQALTMQSCSVTSRPGPKRYGELKKIQNASLVRSMQPAPRKQQQPAAPAAAQPGPAAAAAATTAPAVAANAAVAPPADKSPGQRVVSSGNKLVRVRCPGLLGVRVCSHAGAARPGALAQGRGRGQERRRRGG